MSGSRCKSTYLTSNIIRKTFIDYFVENNHSFVRSSSVSPLGDSTLKFVNAGMNQFKNVFLGFNPPPADSAVNSQKCIRVGGKHNDLNAVGHDSYHHTFFEMLGNWSFGAYFKKEACEHAWKLITSPPYSICPGRLYVTYFGGDKILNLEPDLDTREAWLELGVPAERIVPFGVKDNFWEMGLTGPCGPCTEIHYDHLGTTCRSGVVNQDSPDLTELWNLVFIQYNRLEDGQLLQLPQSYVDTGMGLERLVALLQDKRSNYDTDLFTPLFSTISRVSKIKEYSGKFGDEDVSGLDTCYRILADHARMITISLADNILPDESHGLRRVIRKALLCTEQLCPSRSSQLLTELASTVADSLGDTYPEISANLIQAQLVLKDESLLWTEVKRSVESDWTKLEAQHPEFGSVKENQSIGFIQGIKMIVDKQGALSTSDGLILYDRYGLDLELIEDVSRLKGLSLDSGALQQAIAKLKLTQKQLLSSSTNQWTHLSSLPSTEDSAKWSVHRSDSGEYSVESVSAELLSVFSLQGEPLVLDSLNSGDEVAVVLNKTNMLANHGTSDQGNLKFMIGSSEVASLEVTKVENKSNRILHIGRFQYSKPISQNDVTHVLVEVDARRRQLLMNNLTATHLICWAMKQTLQACKLRSVNISTDGFQAKYLTFGQPFTENDIAKIEKLVNTLIENKLSANLKTLNTEDLFKMGETPQFSTHKLLSIDFERSKIREVTNGPCSLNTEDVADVVICSVEQGKRGKECTIRGLTGAAALQCKRNASDLLVRLNQALYSEASNTDLIEAAHSTIRSGAVPVNLHGRITSLCIDIKKRARKLARALQEKDLLAQLPEAEQNGYLVHIIESSEAPKLDRLSKLCGSVPSLLLYYSNGQLSARCTVPKDCGFTAVEWMSSVAHVLDAKEIQLSSDKSKLVCSLKPHKLNKGKITQITELMRQIGREWAQTRIPGSVTSDSATSR